MAPIGSLSEVRAGLGGGIERARMLRSTSIHPSLNPKPCTCNGKVLGKQLLGWSRLHWDDTKLLRVLLATRSVDGSFRP